MQKKSILTEIISDGDTPMLKSVKSDEHQIKIFREIESQLRSLLPNTVHLFLFIDELLVTIYNG